MTDKSKALLAVADVANKYGILEGRAFDFADAAIAAYTKAVSSEAVVWTTVDVVGDFSFMGRMLPNTAPNMLGPVSNKEVKPYTVPLFAAPQPTPAVPAGWKLVPVEPTIDMILAGIVQRHDEPVPEAWKLATENIYRAMIEAAPEAP